MNEHTPLSGYLIRNSDFGNYKYNNNRLNDFVSKSNNLERKCKSALVDLIDHLVIGLRDRYSGTPHINGGKKLSIGNISEKIVITLAGIATFLHDYVFINNDRQSLIENSKLLASLCTHQHTSFSSITSYPNTLEKYLGYINIATDYSKLINLKIDLERPSYSPLEDNVFKIISGKIHNSLEQKIDSSEEGVNLERFSKARSCSFSHVLTVLRNQKSQREISITRLKEGQQAFITTETRARITHTPLITCAFICISTESKQWAYHATGTNFEDTRLVSKILELVGNSSHANISVFTALDEESVEQDQEILTNACPNASIRFIYDVTGYVYFDGVHLGWKPYFE